MGKRSHGLVVKRNRYKVLWGNPDGTPKELKIPMDINWQDVPSQKMDY